MSQLTHSQYVTATNRSNGRKPRRRRGTAASYCRPLRYEPLEDRRLLAVVTVTTVDDTVDFSDGVLSLREAIFATNTVPGTDTIEFAPALTAGGPATIVLTEGELEITDSLTINGPGANLLTIDASGSDADVETIGNGSRIFSIDNGLSTVIDVELRGLTLTGGDIARSGGAIYSREGLLAEGLIIRGNHAARGGAIELELAGGNATIADCTLLENSANSAGGAIEITAIASGVATVRDSTLHRNTANQGGALYVTKSSANASLIITGSDFTENSATSAGGAISLVSTPGQLATIRSSSLSGNTAGGQGGAIFASNVRDLSIVDSSLLGNVSVGSGRASARGGGIYCANGDLTVTGSTISGNMAVAGGGIYSRNGELTIQFSTISDNTASAGDGGGIFSQNDRLTLIGSTISGNVANSGSTQGGRGGGLFHAPGFVAPSMLLDTVISDNSASELGGGLYFSPNSETVGSASLTLNNLTIVRNSAKRGGGISTRVTGGTIGGTLSTIGGSISNNTATMNGGGLYVSGNLNVTGTTIAGNHAASNGGGIAIPQSSTQLAVWIVDATIDKNSAGAGASVGYIGDGGGVWIPGNLVSLSLIDSRVTNNAARNGGGVFRKDANSRGMVNVTGSTITGNLADQRGGGIYNQGGLVSVNKSVIAGNAAVREAGTGGGIFNRQADLSITYSSIAGNKAQQAYGGGIYHELGDLMVVGSTIAGNLAHGSGAGVWASAAVNDRITIADSTVSGNASTIGTGGLWFAGTTSIRHSTIAENSGGSRSAPPGGLYIQLGGGQSIDIDHTIIASNSDADFTAPDFRFSAQTGLIHLRYSLIGNASDTSLVEAPLGSPDLNGNLIGKPVSAGGSGVIDPLLGPLVDNGGFVLPDGSHIRTHALLPGSPALDGGALVTGSPQGYDQRGNPFSRMVDGTGDGSVRIDIGAYESQGVPHFSPGDYNRNGIVDASDYTVWRDAFGSVQVPFAGADGDGNGIVDQSDYQVWKAHFGQGLTFTLGSGGSGASLAMASIAEPPAEPGAVGAATDVALASNWTPQPPARPRVGSEAMPDRIQSARFAAAPQRDLILAWLAAQPRHRTTIDRTVLPPVIGHSEADEESTLPNDTLDLAFASLGEW